MKKLVLLVVFLTATTGCNAQHSEHAQPDSQTTGAEQNQPQENWTVHKRYDEKGNLIGYDSTYVWSYSNKGKVQSIAADSVLDAFRRQFNKQFPVLFDRTISNYLLRDSLLYRDFTQPDYFMQKWENHYFDIQSMMRDMDSLKNTFLRKHYPQLHRNE